MRVLQVIDRMMRGGGAEKFVLDLSIALNRLPEIEVEVLSIATPLNNDFVDILIQNGIKHNVLSDSLRSFKNIGKLHSYIAAGNYDAVHVHLFPALYYAGLAKKIWNLKCKFCYTEHSTDNRRRGSKLWTALDRFIYKQYNHIIAISGKVKEKLIDHLHCQEIEIINNGIDIDAISSYPITDIRKEFAISQDSKIVTMVSRITKGKDHATLVKAIERLPDEFELFVVGDGPLRPELEKQVRTSTASNRIHLTGLRKDVYGILKASDIVVLSTEHEGFSIAMLEAMACRKPFVASAVPGIQDLVDGIAELFEYGNDKQLAEIIMNIKKSNELNNDISNRCYKFATTYDINRIAKSYSQSYT